MYHPELKNAPTVKPLTRWFARRIIELLGWKLEGTLPDYHKMVMIGGPHTANIDVVYMVLMSMAIGVRLSFLFGDDLNPVFKRLSLWLGGIPIDRDNPNSNTVDQVVMHFNSVDKICLMVSPEGRLRLVEYWRSGFYYIALGAGAVVAPGNIDYPSKTISLTHEFMPTGDIISDTEYLKPFFDNVTARFPEKASPFKVRARTAVMQQRLQDRASRIAQVNGSSSNVYEEQAEQQQG